MHLAKASRIPHLEEVDRKKFFFLVKLLLIAVTLSYANFFLNSFHFDDFHTIVNNSYIRSPGNIPRFFIDATTFSSLPSNQSYRPLVSTTLAIDYFLGRGNVFPFHLSTFILFFAQGFFMYLFYIWIFDVSDDKPENSYIALVAVAWYLLHPVMAETINYIIARSDSLSTLCILVALVCYLYWDLGRRWHLYLIPFAAACLAKPIGAVFAPLLLLYLLLFDEQKKPGLAGLAAVLKKAAPSFLSGLALLAFIKRMTPPSWQAGGASAYDYLITQPAVLFHYFTTFFVPLSLSADTDWAPLTSMLDVRFFCGAAFLAILLVVVGLTARKKILKPIAFGILWFILSLLPTSLMPLAEVMNDHRLFLPFVGLMISVCWTGHLLLEKASTLFGSRKLFYRRTAAVIIMILLVYAYGTHQRNNVWHTEETLWKDVTIKSPKNGRGLMNYGLALMGKGDYAGAEKYFTRALPLVPYYSSLYINLGIVKAATGQDDLAESYFIKAIILNPASPDSYYYYADFLRTRKRYDQSVRYARKTLPFPLPVLMPGSY